MAWIHFRQQTKLNLASSTQGSEHAFPSFLDFTAASGVSPQQVIGESLPVDDNRALLFFTRLEDVDHGSGVEV